MTPLLPAQCWTTLTHWTHWTDWTVRGLDPGRATVTFSTASEAGPHVTGVGFAGDMCLTRPARFGSVFRIRLEI